MRYGEGQMPIRATSRRMRTLLQVMARFGIWIILQRSTLRLALLMFGPCQWDIIFLVAVLLLLVLQACEVLDPLCKRLAARSI